MTNVQICTLFLEILRKKRCPKNVPKLNKALNRERSGVYGRQKKT